MKSMYDYIRKIAEDIQPSKYNLEKIKIFFKTEPVGSSLTVEEDKALEENFQWAQLSLIFSEGEQYYLFRALLSPDGEEYKKQEVFESDSGGKSRSPSKISPEEVVKSFPSILKGSPVLQYGKLEKKTGIKETDVDYGDVRTKKEYSVEQFKKEFYPKKNEKGEIVPFYIVFSTGKEKKGPNGEVVQRVNPPAADQTKQAKEELPVFTDDKVKTLFRGFANRTKGIHSDEYWLPISKLRKEFGKVIPNIVQTKADYYKDKEGVPVGKEFIMVGAFKTPQGKEKAVWVKVTAAGAGSVKDPLDKYDVTVQVETLSPQSIGDAEDKRVVEDILK